MRPVRILPAALLVAALIAPSATHAAPREGATLLGRAILPAGAYHVGLPH